MKYIYLIIIILLSFTISAQKTKIEHDEKTKELRVDGIPAFLIERLGCGLGMVDCHFNVFDLSETKVIRINYRDFNSPVEISNSNPKGTVRYYEFIFLDSKQKAEINYPGISPEKVGKMVITNNLIVDGKLDPKAVDEFVLIHGTKFSERVKF